MSGRPGVSALDPQVGPWPRCTLWHKTAPRRLPLRLPPSSAWPRQLPPPSQRTAESMSGRPG
eukprot:15020434-Heterocapsa_arctica.AAC.1